MAAAPTIDVTIIKFSSETDIAAFAEAMRSAAAFDFAGWRFFPREGLVIERDGRETKLTRLESDLVHTLVKTFPRRWSNDQLADHIGVSGNAVRVHIGRIRRKLGWIIDNSRRGGGYGFTGAIPQLRRVS